MSKVRPFACALSALYGHEVSLDALRTDLAWLAEQALVEVEDGAKVVFGTLTQRGLDVAEGRAKVPGVTRPGP